MTAVVRVVPWWRALGLGVGQGVEISVCSMQGTLMRQGREGTRAKGEGDTRRMLYVVGVATLRRAGLLCLLVYHPLLILVTPTPRMLPS